MAEPLRLLRISLIFSDFFLRHFGLEALKGTSKDPQRLKKAYAHNARTLRRRLVAAKGLMIKLGQFLSTRVDLFPPETIKELAALQDRVAPVKSSLIKEKLRQELGQPARRLFLEFAEKPIAAASLAQVHKARLYDGQKVAVKVLRPEIEQDIQQDCHAIDLLFQGLSVVDRHFDYKRLTEEFKRYLLLETDLKNEADNIDKMRQLLSLPYLRIPEVIPARSSQQVLTTSFIPGFKVTRLSSYEKYGISKDEVAQQILKIYFTMIFQNGFFQADPHPGNIFVIPTQEKERQQIGIVDFGICQALPSSFKSGLGSFIQGFLSQDPAAMSAGLSKMGFQNIQKKASGLDEFSSFILKHATFFTQQPTREKAADFMEELMDLAQRKPMITIPSHFILLARCTGLLTGLIRQLKVSISVNEILLPFLLGKDSFETKNA